MVVTTVSTTMIIITDLSDFRASALDHFCFSEILDSHPLMEGRGQCHYIMA